MKKIPVANQVINPLKKSLKRSKKHFPQTFKANLPFEKRNKRLAPSEIINLFSDLFPRISSRVKRSDDGSLVTATLKNDFSYRLNYEDIIDAADLAYNNYKGREESKARFFEVIRTTVQLETHLEHFLQKKTSRRLTLIVSTLDQHWFTLVVSRRADIKIYYADSKNDPEQYKAYKALFDAFKISPNNLYNLTPDFIQQEDGYNGGLWALENAADINRMLDFDGRFAWGVNQLKQYRGESYFIEKRKEFSRKFLLDSNWRQLHDSIVKNIQPEQEKFFSLESLTQSGMSADKENEPAAKRIKTDHKKDINVLLSVFVRRFLTNFTERLAACHVSAREELVTIESLKTELITGATGALVGAAYSGIVANSMMGAVPSVAASARAITSKFLVKTQTAQKITKYFDGVEKGSLATILCEAAVDIFYNFEYQFKRVSDKAGDYVAMEKLADDSVSRALAYIKKLNSDESVVTKELIEKAVVRGASEAFFNLSLQKFQLRSRGRNLVNANFENIENKKIITTAELYENTGLISFGDNEQPNKVYQPLTHPLEFGYRRLFDWEKDDKGELKLDLQTQYRIEFPGQDLNDYALKAETKKTAVESILNKLKPQSASQAGIIPALKINNKESILFDLRDPVPDFTGRTQIREDLHQILTGSSSSMAVISAFSAMSISSTSGFSSQGGSAMQSPPLFSSDSSTLHLKNSQAQQLSLSGLGGIGKTQLALQYAKEHASDYDNNVLWINAETLESLDASFTKLARKLRIATCCEHDKNLEELAEEIYGYFSDRKSLFIFDNVVNYHEIKNFLPKLTQGNKPTLLITSRYSHWDNVATVLPLEVFTASETIELFEKSGTLADIPSIEKLHQLLHGLPLAIRQAIAYITLQRRFKPDFSIYDYMNLYKEKSQELLKFDLSHYANDPYLETVFTTWLVTLNKIQADSELGATALELLDLMTYVDPENIKSNNFYALKYMQGIPGDLTLYIDHVKKAMFLLTSYSMINTDFEGTFKIHRLVQQVQRIILEHDPDKFRRIVTETQILFDYQRAEVEDTHYLHFLLYMSEYEYTREILHCDSIKQLFDKLSNKENKYWIYFLDLAYHKFSKVRYLEFLSDSLAYSRKEGFIVIVDKSLKYFEEQVKTGAFTKDDVCYLFNRCEESSSNSRLYSLNRYSRNEDKKLRQKAGVRLVYMSKDRIFGGYDHYLAYKAVYDDKISMFGDYGNYLKCSVISSRKKRSLCAREQNPKDLEQSKIEIEQSHIEKVGLVTHYVGSGLMTKNILSAVTRGDWDEVAINFELIASSELLGKLSNDFFLTRGTKLETEAQLLKNNLGLENKKVWSLLVDRKVSFIGKKLVLGKSLQVASSFVSRGTGIYFAYNLKKQIEAYQAGETELLPEIISNGVVTGTTFTEIGLEGLEYLKYITRIAGRVNPYLEGVSGMVWLSVEIYEAEEQVQAIQKHVHLSWKQWYVEFCRGFFHYPPSSYLQAKAKNAELVEHAVKFLKNQTDFSRYIAPIFSDELKLYEDNWALLNSRIFVTLSNVMPDQPSEGRLFCQYGLPVHTEEEQAQAQSTYYCYQAMGVEYPRNRTGDINLINLGTGNDTVTGSPYSPNYFFVQNGEKKYSGGDEGNIFRLEGNATWGQLKGGNKSDALLLEQFIPEESVYILIDSEGYLCGPQQPLLNLAPPACSFNTIKLSGLNQIYGRHQQQDVIYLNPDIHFFDGHGGSAELHPDIVFVTEHSYKNPTVVLRNNTLVLFALRTPIQLMDYQIPMGEIGQAEVKTHFNAAMQHRFFFDCAVENILVMHAENNGLTIAIGVENDSEIGRFTLTISNLDTNQNNNATNFEKNSSYFFQNTEIKLINNQQLFAQQLLAEELPASKTSLQESIERYSEMARYLNKTLTLQLRDNSTLAIGRGEHEIFYADGLFPSHLVGNGGENVYQVMANDATHFPLARITLYRLPFYEPELTERIDTLDLRQLVGYMKKTCPKATIIYQLSLIEEDLFLSFMSSTPAEGQCTGVKTTWYLANICLKAGLDWYQNLDVLLENNIPKRIVSVDGKKWMLEDAPLLFTENKKIISLTDQDLGENTEISLLRKVGHYSCFRNDSDLIMTNIHTEPFSAWTMVAHDYYHNPAMKQKVLSAKLDFLDEDFYLKEYQSLIDEAESFSDLVEQLKKPENERKHFPLLIPIRNKELPKLRLKRQIPLSMKFRLASPESKGWVSLGIGTSLTVMLTLTGCFYWRSKRRQQTVPLLVAALSSLPAVSAHEQKIFAEKTPVDFSSGFSIENDCLTAMTPMGWLAVCENKQSLVFLKNHQKSGSFYFESYQMNNSFLQRVGAGVWEANLCETTHNALAEEIYPLLPKHWQKELLEQWSQQRAWSNWKYHAGMTVTSMVGDGLVLHTPVGNIFKQLGLAPDWQTREDRYFLSRCGLALAQPLFHLPLSSNGMSLGLISMELALLHPATHRAYRYLSQQGDVTKAKFALRLVADMLQLGVNQLSHLANILDYCFPASDLVKHMSLALRISHYFYFLTGDLSYWHLGLALLFLPQLPQLLDHIGIPASRAVQKVCQQLANVLLSQSLLQNLAKDAERQAQSDHELSRADARVTQAQQCFKRVAMASSRFFQSKSACSANDEHQEKSVALPFFK